MDDLEANDANNNQDVVNVGNNHHKCNRIIKNVILFMIIIGIIIIFIGGLTTLMLLGETRFVKCDIKGNSIKICDVWNDKYKISYNLHYSKNNITSNRTCYSRCKFTKTEANKKIIEIEEMNNIRCNIKQENLEILRCPI